MHKRQSDASSDHRQLHGAHQGSWPESVSDSSMARWGWNDKGLTCSYSYTLSGLRFQPKAPIISLFFSRPAIFFLWKSNEIKIILKYFDANHRFMNGSVILKATAVLYKLDLTLSFTSAHFIDGFWGHSECHKAGTRAVRQPDRFYTNLQFKLIT